MDWDQSLVELTTVTSSRIPAKVEEQWGRARHRANCGLLPGLRHAWVSVDSTLFMWDYSSQDAAVLMEFQADSVIISAATCPPRPGVFDVPCIQFLLVLATRLTVSLIAIVPEHVEGVPPGMMGGAQHAKASRHPGGHQRSKIKLAPLGGYNVPVEGALFHCIRHNQDGNIFLLCGAPQVYELAYSRTSGLFHPKCRLVRHSLGWWPWARDFVAISPHGSGRVRLLECAPRGYMVTVDDANTLRLLRLQDTDSHGDRSSGSLEELCSLTANEMSARLFTLTKMRLASPVIVYAFPCLGLDDHLHLHVVTAAGERLHFVCSASSRTGPSSLGPLAQAARVTSKATQRFHGFWLQQALPNFHHAGSGSSSSWSGTNSLSSAGLDRPRTACIEEDRDPCIYSGGVWVASLRKADVTATNIGVTARIDGPTCGAGIPGALDLCSVLKFDGQALDIVEEHDQSNGLRFMHEPPLDGNLGAFCGRRSFAILFPDGVKLLNLSYRAQSLSFAPTSAQECCAHLMQLCLPPSSASLAAWTWTMEDAQIPSFEEQQQHMALAHTLPPMHLGRWFGGLLRFLAIVLRPIWSLPLIVPTSARPIFQFYKRRRVTGSCLALNEGLVHHVLSQLRPALSFVERGHAAHSLQPPRVTVSAASRSRYFARKLVNNGEMQAQAQQLLSEVLDITKNVQEILGFLSVVHRHGGVQALMRSPSLSGELLRDLCERPVGALSTTLHSLEPVVRLCAIFHAECLSIYPGGHQGRQAVLLDLQQMCPVIFQQVETCAAACAAAWHPGDAGSELGAPGAAGQNPRPAEPAPEPSPVRDRPRGGEDPGLPSAAAGSSGNDILRNFARFLPKGPVEDRWAAVARIIPAVASENLPGAVELCAQELLRLPPGEPASPGRAQTLLAALLEKLIERPAVEIRSLLESFFTRTNALKFADSREGADGGGVSAELPFVHATVLAQLLTGAEKDSEQTEPPETSAARQACRTALEALLSPPMAAEVGPFLRDRYPSSRAAGECLSTFYSETGQVDRACGIWMQLADRSGQNCSLHRCINDLQKALALAKSSEELWAQEAVQNLSLRLQVAQRVQVPLRQELAHLAQDPRLASKWRQAAKQRQDELRMLQGLRELCQTAEEFGLFHIMLIIADFSEPAQPRDQWSMIWVHVFCPPLTSPYWMSHVAGDSHRAALTSGSPAALFPLLMVRHLKAFYPLEDGATPQLLADMASYPHPELAVSFELRVTALFEELRHLTKVHGPCWDVRFIATLLEYCNCVWFHAVDPHETSSQNCGTSSSPRAWMALRVLSMKPFSLSLAETVRLYAEMLRHVPLWVKDLQERLPEGVSWPALGDDDLQVHLSEVLLALLNRLVSDMQPAAGTEGQALRMLRQSWKETGEGLLGDLGLRLNGLQLHHPAARRLLTEAIRLQAEGRHACNQLQSPAAQAFKAILQSEPAPSLDPAAGGMGVETQ
mmetsp:Transcript_35069/g.64910  ORF Transcript_35069/g.64910 Transcript_35069/m.64910 type:complete len:1460 (+) Transcript_35069:1-4380(+)